MSACSKCLWVLKRAVTFLQPLVQPGLYYLWFQCNWAGTQGPSNGTQAFHHININECMRWNDLSPLHLQSWNKAATPSRRAHQQRSVSRKAICHRSMKWKTPGVHFNLCSLRRGGQCWLGKEQSCVFVSTALRGWEQRVCQNNNASRTPVHPTLVPSWDSPLPVKSQTNKKKSSNERR